MKHKTEAAPRRRPAVPAPQDEIVDLEDVIELPDMAELEAEEKLAVFHNKFGGEDYKIRVEIFNKDENDWDMVANLKLAGFDSFDSLRKYGAGRYRLSLLDTGGHYVKGGRMDARISPAAIEAHKIENPPAVVENGMTAIVAMLQNQNTQNLELMKAMIGRPLPPESKGPSLTELITAMSGLRGLTPKDEGGMGGVKGTLELMKLVKELMPEPDKGGNDGSLVGELSQAVELFGKVSPMLEARRRANPAPATRPANLAASGAIVMPSPEPEPEPEDPMKPINDKIQSYIPGLTAWAARGKDIEDAADFVLDEVEAEIVPLIVKHYRPGGITLTKDFIFGQLLEKANDPAQVEAIFAFAPALAPYKEWFARVIAKAVEFATDQEDAPDVAPAPAAEVNGNAS